MSGNLEGKGRGGGGGMKKRQTKILADAEHAASVTDLVKEEVCYSDSRNMNFVESFQQNSTCEFEILCTGCPIILAQSDVL